MALLDTSVHHIQLLASRKYELTGAEGSVSLCTPPRRSVTIKGTNTSFQPQLVIEPQLQVTCAVRFVNVRLRATIRIVAGGTMTLAGRASVDGEIIPG